MVPHVPPESAQAFRAIEIPLRRVWLGDIIWLHEKKYGDLLVWHVADVHGAVRPVTGLVPVDLPGPGGRWQISAGGGLFPLWSRNGRELLHQTRERRIMAVSSAAKADSRKAAGLVGGGADQYGPASNYDLAPDGKRVAALLGENADEKPATHLVFLLNLF